MTGGTTAFWYPLPMNDVATTFFRASSRARLSISVSLSGEMVASVTVPGSIRMCSGTTSATNASIES